jgi:hypothetical protein
VLEKAIQLQKQIVDKARGQYSLTLNAQAQEQHERNVLRLAKDLREVAVCFDAEDKLFEELRALDASVRLRPMRVNAVGSVRDYYSRDNMSLREIQELFSWGVQTTGGAGLKKPQRAYRFQGLKMNSVEKTELLGRKGGSKTLKRVGCLACEQLHFHAGKT